MAKKARQPGEKREPQATAPAPKPEAPPPQPKATDAWDGRQLIRTDFLGNRWASS